MQSTLRSFVGKDRVLRRSSRHLSAGIVLITLVMAATSCSAPTPDRRDPTGVVQDYLTAISEGDATRASELDQHAIEVETTNKPIAEYGDFHTLRTDAVLLAAERIEDVVIDSKTRTIDGDENHRSVAFTYGLDEQPNEASLEVMWNEQTSEWELETSFTLLLYIDAKVSTTRIEAAPFRIGGDVHVEATDPELAPLAYLVYPGGYTIVGAFPEELLAPGEDLTRTLVADYPGDASTTFAVTRLPSE